MLFLANQAEKSLYQCERLPICNNKLNKFHHYHGIESAFAPTHIHSFMWTHTCTNMDFIHFCVSMRTLREHTHHTHMHEPAKYRGKSVRWLLLLLCQMWWFCLSLLCHNKAHKSCCNHHTDTQKTTHTNPHALTHPRAFSTKANTHANVSRSIRTTRTSTLTLMHKRANKHTQLSCRCENGRGKVQATKNVAGKSILLVWRQ